MIRIINNKKLDLTDSEWTLYQEICTAYDRDHFQGKDLFNGLFETDKTGKIIFLIPPRGKQFSMEVYLFLVNIMIHQHLGGACDDVNNVLKEARTVIKEAKDLITTLKK